MSRFCILYICFCVPVFTARRYASAVNAMAPCLSVYLSVCLSHWSSTKTDEHRITQTINTTRQPRDSSFPGAKDLMFDNTDSRPTLWYSIGSLASQLASLVGSEMPLILVPI